MKTRKADLRARLKSLNKRWPQALRFSLHSLRAQLMLWIALPAAIVLIGVSMLEIRGHEHAMHELVHERAAGLAQATAVLIAGRIDHGYDTLADSAGELGAHGSLPLASAAHFPAGLALFHPDGEFIESSLPTAWPTAPSSRALVQSLSQGETPRAATFFDETSQEWLLVQAMPAVVNSEPRVLAGAISLPRLASTELIATFLPDTDLAMWIENDAGEVIAELAGSSALRDNPTADKTVTIYVPIDEAAWRVVLRESWAALVPPLLRYEGVALLGVLMVIGVSLLSAYFGLRSIVRPLRRLDEAAGQVGWGNYDAVRKPVGGVAEIEDLRLALVRMVDQVRQYQQEMKSYISAMTLGQEEERKRLARELHDETVQALIVLKQQIELAEKTLTRDPQQAADRLRQLHPLVADIINDLRRHIHGLRPLYLEDLGFITALEMLIKETSERYGLVSDLEVFEHGNHDSDTRAPQLSPAVELSAYRIAQEALHNIVTHADARWVHVELTLDAAGMTLRIEDNGVGFDAPKHPHQLAYQGHYGLMGIQERVQLHGGRLEIESEKGKGAALTAWLPNESNETTT